MVWCLNKEDTDELQFEGEMWSYNLYDRLLLPESFAKTKENISEGVLECMRSHSSADVRVWIMR